MSSQKTNPGDFDCLFVSDDTRIRLEDDEEAKELTDYLRCKEKGYGDIFTFPASVVRSYPAFCRLDLFDYDKTTRQPKGVVEVEI